MISDSIEKAAEALEQGNVIAIPTETVYGIAANAFNSNSIQQIYQIKERPSSNPLIVHIGSVDQLASLTSFIPNKAKELIHVFWPGPLTLLFPKSSNVLSEVNNNLPEVAVRMPAHPMCLSLLKKLSFPLVAPSANRYGSISPTEAQHVEDGLGDRISMVLDGGPCMIGLESTIVGFDEHENCVVYRLGAITIEELEAVVGPVQLKHHQKNKVAPGMALRHYAPNTKLQLKPNLLSKMDMEQPTPTAFLFFKKPVFDIPKGICYRILSPEGNTREAAKELYRYLHELDQEGATLIVAEMAPEQGLGKVINDKLFRASQPWQASDSSN